MRTHEDNGRTQNIKVLDTVCMGMAVRVGGCSSEVTTLTTSVTTDGQSFKLFSLHSYVHTIKCVFVVVVAHTIDFLPALYFGTTHN